MKVLISGLLVIVAVTFFSCGGDDDEGSGLNTPVTFLTEGARFDYYSTSFFSEDSIITIVEEQIGKDTFLVRNYSESVTVFPTQYWVLKNNNYYTSFRLRDRNMYIIECKFNKPVGTSWKVKKGPVTYTYTIKELNATITTGQAEITDAVKIEIKAPGSSAFYQYVSPTVGPIGSGNFEDLSTSLRLVKHASGSAAITTNVVPAITYGNFPFLKVGNFWTYAESSLAGDDELTVTVESKLSGKNIYKVNIAYESGGESDGYWYEDNGYLMAYDEGEEITEADPIYIREDLAQMELGWTGLTLSDKFFIYEIESLDEAIDTYYGELPSMGIGVTDGLFSFQTNYWNANKGNVLVSGFVSRNVIGSNVRQGESGIRFIPIVAPW